MAATLQVPAHAQRLAERLAARLSSGAPVAPVALSDAGGGAVLLSVDPDTPSVRATVDACGDRVELRAAVAPCGTLSAWSLC